MEKTGDNIQFGQNKLVFEGEQFSVHGTRSKIWAKFREIINANLQHAKIYFHQSLFFFIFQIFVLQSIEVFLRRDLSCFLVCLRDAVYG
ncbi:hypothetical protein RIF29_08892 [Crotalaria pallida]|uniref:Uncharacterized protein n=1 Tax=Crotalaria pallida TaxID=3830 RepID=A0AAN9FXQ2_CROPI